MESLKDIFEHRFFNDVWWHLVSANTADLTEDENIFFDIYCTYHTDKDIILKTPGILKVILAIMHKYDSMFDE